MAAHGTSRGQYSDGIGLILWVAVCLAASAIGGTVTRLSAGGWYQQLVKPPFNPPDWVFTPVWITLFVFMGVAAWLVWRRVGFRDGREPLVLFGVQLALNICWSVLFFGARSTGWSLVEIVFLWLAILATTVRFYPVSRVAAWLMFPYVLWVAFAIA